MTDCKKPKRVRLTRKQRCFFINVFEAGWPIPTALQDLRIRRRTLQRWLDQPHFRQELEMHMSQFDLETRMEVARSTPAAISSLNSLGSTSLNHEFVRKTLNDVIKLRQEFARQDTAAKSVKKEEKTETFGALLASFGFESSHFLALLEQFCLSKSTQLTPPKPDLKLKNAENTQFPRLLASKNLTQPAVERIDQRSERTKNKREY